jgi:hypothetical protein
LIVNAPYLTSALRLNSVGDCVTVEVPLNGLNIEVSWKVISTYDEEVLITLQQPLDTEQLTFLTTELEFSGEVPTEAAPNDVVESIEQHLALSTNTTEASCKPRAPCMVAWIIRQPISPPLHVYKLRSRASQSRTRHFTIHSITHFVSCSQLLTPQAFFARQSLFPPKRFLPVHSVSPICRASLVNIAQKAQPACWEASHRT